MTPNVSTGTHSHSAYYDENEITSASPHVSHSRAYDQVHSQHEFHSRLTQSGDPAGTAGVTGTGEGAMFYAPSNFAPTRMAAHQYSAVPPSTGATYPSQTGYLDSDLPPPSTTSTTGTYYAGAQNQNHSPTQYTVTPLSSLHPNLDASSHTQNLTTNSLSAGHSSHVSSGPMTSSAVPGATAPRSTRLVDPPSPTNLNARRHTTSDIGKRKTFASGPFMGRTIRAEVKEVQKADLGRKCADPPTGSSGHGSHHGGGGAGAGGGSGAGKEVEGIDGAGSRRGKEKEHQGENAKETQGEAKAVRKDRRPLDPPPVVELKFYECIHLGTPHEFERLIPAEEVEIGGLICQVDLFRVTIPPSPTEVATLTLQAHAGGIGPVHGGQAFGYGSGPAGLGLQSHGHGHPSQSPYEQQGFAYPPHPPARRQSILGTEEENNSAASPLDAGWESASPVSPVSPYTYHTHPSSHHPPVHPHGAHTLPALNTHIPTLHHVNSPPLGAPIDPDALPLPSESDKLSRVLFGESYSHACSILDLHGRPVLYFVFSDLSVKLEGLFRPRYRFFDLFSRTSESPDVPILAQCFGGTFAVYSTKEFPGLKASTPLTKHLSRWGIRVNIRETERKRRAPDGNSVSTGGAGTGKEKKRGGGGRKARGGSVAGSAGAGGASSSASVRGDDDADERAGSASSPVTMPRMIDAPKRYLEGATRGRGGRGRTAVSAGTAGGEARGRGKNRED